MRKSCNIIYSHHILNGEEKYFDIRTIKYIYLFDFYKSSLLYKIWRNKRIFGVY